MQYPNIDRLFELPRFLGRHGPGYNPGLERMTALLAAIGDPHLAAPVAHVAGTNGKGSTASMIAAIGTASGRKVGLHTSPHLVRITERMRVDGVPAPEAWLDDAVCRFRDAIRGTAPSFFEATAALSFLYFAEMGVDAAVIEVGLGGRLDATNVVGPTVCVITSIGLDHVDILGSTHELIAREKAGIIKPGIPVVSGVDDPKARDAIVMVARQKKARLIEPAADDLNGLEPGLKGVHQVRNASIAAEAARTLWPGLEPDSIAHGLRNVVALAGLRGRIEEVEPGFFVDVAHNADGLSAALASLRRDGKPVHVVIALMSDKDAENVGSVLAEWSDSVSILDLAGERLRPVNELETAFRRQGVNIEDVVTGDELLDYARQRIEAGFTVLASGSHVVVAEVLRRLEEIG